MWNIVETTSAVNISKMSRSNASLWEIGCLEHIILNFTRDTIWSKKRKVQHTTWNLQNYTKIHTEHYMVECILFEGKNFKMCVHTFPLTFVCQILSTSSQINCTACCSGLANSLLWDFIRRSTERFTVLSTGRWSKCCFACSNWRRLVVRFSTSDRRISSKVHINPPPVAIPPAR